MKPIYCFDLTNNEFSQIDPFQINEANEILYGHDYYSHSSFLADIIHAYIRYELIDLKFKPQIAICLDKKSIYKIKSTDEEKNIESLISFLKLMVPPKGGVKICFFESTFEKKHVDFFRNFQGMWALKEEWKGNKNYIAVGKFREKPYLKKLDNSFVFEFAQQHSLDVVEIGYGQTIKQQHKILKECKFIVSQRGSITYFAAMMKTPLILLTDDHQYNIPLLLDNNQLGGIMFQNTIVGMDPNVTHFDNNELLNYHYDKFLLTRPDYSKNQELLEKVLLNPNQMQEHYQFIIKQNQSAYNDQINKLKNKMKAFIND